MKPLHQSGMKVAASCLRRFYAERVEGVDGSSTASDFGTIAHKCVEMAYIASATGNVSQLAAALSALRGIEMDRKDVPSSVFARVEAQLRIIYSPESSLYLRLPGRGDKMQVEWTWGLTADFVACKPDDPECAFTGRCDEVRWGESGVRERDWKFIQAMHSKEDAEESIQRRVYAVALLAHFNVPSTFGSFVMMLHDYEAEAEFIRDAAWHKWTKSWMTRVRERILRAERDGDWPAQVGEACAYCPIRHSCDEWLAMYRQGKVDDLAIEDKALRYLRDKAAASEYERELRRECEESPLTVGVGRVLGFKPGTRSKQKPLADCLSILRADDVTDADIAEYLPTINKGNLETLAKVLLKRGVIECAPYEWAAMFYDEVPSVTFTTFPDDSE